MRDRETDQVGAAQRITKKPKGFDRVKVAAQITAILLLGGGFAVGHARADDGKINPEAKKQLRGSIERHEKNTQIATKQAERAGREIKKHEEKIAVLDNGIEIDIADLKEMVAAAKAKAGIK